VALLLTAQQTHSKT